MSNEKQLATSSTPLPSVWTKSVQGIENRKKSVQTISMKHGMMASIPIICRGRSCPYFETCWIPEADLQVGERCPIEIAAVVERFDQYCQSLHIDTDNVGDMVDAGIVKDVVDIEVLMLRADSLLAKSGTFIEDVVAGVTPKGQSITKPELHKAAEYKEELRRQKIKLLNQLNATRKDKKEEGANNQDPSSVAARIIAKVKELEKSGKIIDIDAEPIEGEIVEETNVPEETVRGE